MKKIIKGCRKRQRDSQKELYKMFYAYGMSITLRYADSREEAVTILNDAFMKLFSNIAQYDPERPFKPWLRRIIINTAINYFHKHKSSLKREQLENVESEIAHDETIISKISYQEIIDLIQQLSPAYRTVFNLHVIEGFQHKEIAEMLGIAEGTSKSNLSKAKKNLQAILEKNLTQ
ncbi:RNA polymerase sigma factor [Aliifodinibius salicampi]|uniref:RNA polymerase sigma factor n=1 Tax=Fodinibius salicampi TaxID=1920655 RepID=A0ABT3Q2G6_9BACT|nr:RNA polymerase sigma factor [Fodinibius salicampi]MCW9714198.1 RNA polymerase sigma factor [Fodinibius salicampi]